MRDNATAQKDFNDVMTKIASIQAAYGVEDRPRYTPPRLGGGNVVNIGMLWYCPSGTLQERLETAAAYYAAKYGARPNRVLIHPDHNPPPVIAGLTVQTTKTIQKNHFLLGVNP